MKNCLHKENNEVKIQKKTEEFLPGACTCMTLTSKTGKHYWFRTCDIETDIWQGGAHAVCQKKGKTLQYDNGRCEEIAYSYIGMTYNQKDTWLLDGINECGLTGGLLMLPEGTSVDKPASDRKGYVGMELVTKFLSACKDVEEVKELAGSVQVMNIPYGEMSVPATMHYFFTDITGNEVILEAADRDNPGAFSIYCKDEILGVMTNSPPYPMQLKNFAWFLSQSAEMKYGVDGQAITELEFDKRVISADEKAEHISASGMFPASYSSYDRFIRMAIMKALNKSGNEFEDDKMLALGSNLMNCVNEPSTKGIFHYANIKEDGNITGQKDSITQYIIMYDMEEKCFCIKPFDMISWTKYELTDKCESGHGEICHQSMNGILQGVFC